jgi:flagellar biogenesis protein FliO
MRKMNKIQNNNEIIIPERKNSKKWLKPVVLFILVFFSGVMFLYYFYWRTPDEAGENNMESKLAGETVSQQYSLAEISDESGQVYNSTALAGSDAQANGIGMFVKVVVSMVVIIILIYIVVRVLKFFYRNKGAGGADVTGGNSFIEVLESKNIAPNRSIHLVSIAGKYIIIGSSEKQVNYISSIPPKQYKEFRTINENVEVEKGKERGFRDILQSYFGNIGR